ncbi:MAG TPA: DUF5916 domain-containing protein [Fimbriimonadaceae bacterium]|nr:DUF5916 domain-containing protein [Fimbriimonadaceae bacterium]
MRLALFLAALPALTLASPNEVPAVKVSQAPQLDGKIAPGEWDAIGGGTGFVDENTAQATEGGQFWLGYDDKFIYFAARLEMENPKAIRADEFRTNVSLSNDDAVYLGLETFGGLSNFNVFGVNSRGATSIQIAGGRAAKREWLGEFQAAGRPTETGFEVEARIPWSVMRLPSPGLRDIRFNVFRFGPVSQRTSVWKYTKTDPEQMGKWLQVDIPAQKVGRPIKLLPYAFAGFENSESLTNAGLDIKTSLTDSVDLVGTINPDFRNVENQVLSLDFSYFERLAGESRPFFLEGSQFFQTSRDNPIFSSQRIRKFDAGVKVFGQLDSNTDFAVLDTIDLGHRNNFVGKFNKRFSENSSGNVAVASVSDASGASNDTLFGSFFAGKDGMGTFGQYSLSKDTDRGYGHRINTGFTYQRDGWNGALEYVELSPNYFPRLGFAPRTDFRGGLIQGNYTRPARNAGIIEAGFGIEAFDYHTTDGKPYNRGFDVSSTTTWKNGADLDFGYHNSHFRGNNDQLFAVSLDMPRGNAYRYWSTGFQVGNLAGRRYNGVYFSTAYRPLPRFQLTGSVEHVRHFEKSTQTIIGANYDLSADQSVSGRMVRQGNDTNAYLAWRRAGSYGAEYYVILGDPNARTFRTSLVLKAVFPFELP